MKAIERAAIARILIDLIKADKVIDSREMDLYDRLKSKFSITRKDETEAYSITLGRAVETIKEMEPQMVADLLGSFEDMTVSDRFCAREEALLMLMLRFCLDEDFPPSDVISTPVDEPWFDERQVLYIESHNARDINAAIASGYRAIERELKLCGLDFVYLPQVIHHYITTPRPLLKQVMSLLSPSLSDDAITEMINKIKLFKTDTFCIEQLHHKLGFAELADTPPALMMRISQSKVAERICTNFLRVELTPEVTEIVRRMVDTFLSYNGSDRIIVSHKKDEKGSFLYNGFYRQLFEILLLQKSVTCHLTVDFIHSSLSFPEIDLTLTGLHRKEKALYTLFLYEGSRSAIRDQDGTVRQNGGINFTSPATARQMPKFCARMELLQKKYALVYSAFGGDRANAPDITKSDIRLPMISGIRKAIGRHSEKIYDADRFIVNRDKNGIYSITANLASFLCRDFNSPGPTPITESKLFADLDRLS